MVARVAEAPSVRLEMPAATASLAVPQCLPVDEPVEIHAPPADSVLRDNAEVTTSVVAMVEAVNAHKHRKSTAIRHVPGNGQISVGIRVTRAPVIHFHRVKVLANPGRVKGMHGRWADLRPMDRLRSL